MAYDRELAERVRAALSSFESVQEKAMFGGLAFLVGGHMAVAAGSKGALLVRVDPVDSEALLAGAGVERMEMRGRSMAGWLLVEPEMLATEAELRGWVERSVAFVRTLLPKPAAPPRRPTPAKGPGPGFRG